MLSGLTAQALKPVLNRQWYNKLDRRGRRLPRYGGMPSAHAAFVVSVATVVGMEAGITSVAFVIAAAMVILVFDEALRMRIFLSQHGLILKELVKLLPEKERRGLPYLESRLGHKPIEVAAGSLIGIAVSLLALLVL